MSLEMPLIDCKIHLELHWTRNCVKSNVAGVTAFPIVTLSTKDNVNLKKQLNEEFKRSSFQRVNRLFVLPFK